MSSMNVTVGGKFLSHLANMQKFAGEDKLVDQNEFKDCLDAFSFEGHKVIAEGKDINTLFDKLDALDGEKNGQIDVLSLKGNKEGPTGWYNMAKKLGEADIDLNSFLSNPDAAY